MKTLLLVLVFFSVQSFGAVEVVWRMFETNYFYEDSTKKCDTKFNTGNTHLPGESYIALEVVNGVVKGGRISNRPNIEPYTWIYKSIDLTQAELDSIEIVRSPNRKLWIKKMTLDSSKFKWLLHYSGKDHYWCSITSVPRALNFSSKTIPFETEGIEQGIETSYSDWMKFEGETGTGDAFKIEFRVVQREVTP